LTRAALLVEVFIFAGIASLAVLPLPPLLVLKAAVLIGVAATLFVAYKRTQRVLDLSSATMAIYWFHKPLTRSI
jgi:hypothetical protein